METSNSTKSAAEKVASAGLGAAALKAAADYLRDQDLESLLSRIPRIVKRHPGAVLLTAAALGFLVARTLSRR